MLAAKAPSASGLAILNRRNSRADPPKAPSFTSNIATPDGEDQLYPSVKSPCCRFAGQAVGFAFSFAPTDLPAAM